MDTLLHLLRFVGVLFLALMILNVMILVHEWGHFLAARWRGLKVEKFQIWFGKPIWKKTVNGVQYGLGCIPMGGFVALPQMAPMEAIEGSADGPKEPLPPISPLDKIIVAFAGPLFSFLLALFFACIVWQIGRPIDEAANPTRIGFVDPKGAAAAAGLKAGDTIRKIDGTPVVRWHGAVESVQWAIVSSPHDDIQFEVERQGESGLVTVPVKAPRRAQLEDEEKKNATGGFFRQAMDSLLSRPPIRQVGIFPQEPPIISALVPNSPAERAGLQRDDLILSLNGKPVPHMMDAVLTIQEARGKPIEFLIQRGSEQKTLVITPQVPTKPESLAKEQKAITGIVEWGTARDKNERSYVNPFTQVTEVAISMKNTFAALFDRRTDLGVGHMSAAVKIVSIYYMLFEHPDPWSRILWFSVVLNINLAIINLFPFPVLDGGHILMALIEAVRRRPLNTKMLEIVQTACVLLLLSYMGFVTLKDIGDLRGGGKTTIEFGPPPDTQTFPAAIDSQKSAH